MRSRVAYLQRLLPRGGSLPVAEWRRRHRALTRVNWTVAALLVPYSVSGGYGVVHTSLHVAPILAFGLIAGHRTLGIRGRSVALALALLGAAGMFVHASHGLIESHFAFFVLIVALTLYEDWTVFAVAIVFVLLHHGGLGMLDPDEVYSGTSLTGSPWTWAAVHAAFVAAAGLAAVTAWRFNEKIREELRHAAAERERREHETRLILDTAHDAFVSIDERGRVVDWNPKAESTFGWAGDEVLGLELAELIIPPAMRDEHRAGLRRFVDTGEARVVNNRVELEALHRDGHTFPVEITISASRRKGRYIFNAFMRDITERRRNERYVAAQYEVTRLLADAPAWEEAEAGLLAALGTPLGWEFGALWAWDGDEEALRCRRTWKADGADVGAFERATIELSLAAGEGLPGRVWSGAGPVWIPDVGQYPDFARPAAATAVGIRAGVGIPIVNDGQAVAVGEFFTHDARPPDPALMTLLAGLGAQVGQFYVRKQSERRALEEARLLATLGSATQQLTRVTDPEAARPAVCTAALEVSDGKFAQLFEPTTGGGLELTATVGVHLPPVRLEAGERSGAITALRTKKRMFVHDVREDPHVSPRLAAYTGARSLVFEPVLGEVGVVGVLVIAWHEPIDGLPPRLASALPLLAAEAAVAIERTNLMRHLSEAAHTDPLTGAVNRRGLDDELPREIARARRTRAPLSVAMLDLDCFKAYNDEHGHQAGDRLLKEIGAGWRARLRETDILGRVGGDEFLVIFPDCTLADASRLTDRLREAIPRRQTCSAGLAAWESDDTAEDLLARADAALYEAKAGGRDQTTAA